MASAHLKNNQIDYLNQGILATLPTMEEKISCLKNFNTSLSDDAFLFFIQHENKELSSAVLESYNNELPTPLKTKIFKEKDFPLIRALISRGEAFNTKERNFILESFSNQHLDVHSQILFIQNVQTPFERKYILNVINRKNEDECAGLLYNRTIHLEETDYETLFQYFQPNQPFMQRSTRVTRALLSRPDFKLKTHHIKSLDHVASLSIQRDLAKREDYLPSIQKIDAILNGHSYTYTNESGSNEIFDGRQIQKHPSGNQLIQLYRDKKPLWEKKHLSNNLQIQLEQPRTPHAL